MASTLSARRYYRKRVKKSLCTGKVAKSCHKIKGCKNTKSSTKRRIFCRKRHNTRRNR